MRTSAGKPRPERRACGARGGIVALGVAVLLAGGVVRRALGGEVPSRFARGDANDDGGVDISDGIAILDFLFGGTFELRCEDAGDANDDGRVDLSDAIRIFNWLFLGALPPPPPGPGSCGADPTDDAAGCEAYASCPRSGLSIETPGEIVVEATGELTPVEWTVEASDPSDPAPELSCDPASGSGFPLGTTEVVCTARNDRGDEATATFPVTVQDTTPPGLTVAADPLLVAQEDEDGASVDPTEHVTAEDLVDPAPEVVCTPPAGVFPPGDTEVTCEATDASGNRAEVSFAVRVGEGDTEPPVVTILAPQDGAEVQAPGGAVDIEVSFEDVGSGVDPSTLEASVGGLTLTEFTVTGNTATTRVRLGSDGNFLTVSVEDRAGNVGTAEALFTVEIIPDETAPVLEVISPVADTCAVPGTPVEMTFEDTESGILTVGVVLNGTPVLEELESGNGTVSGVLADLSPLEEGPNELRLVALDLAGNEGESVVDFALDATAPALVATPAEGELHRTGDPLEVAWSDAGCGGVDPASFSATLDGEDVTASFTAGASGATAGLPLAEGPHTLELRVDDGVGHEAVRRIDFEAVGPASGFELALEPGDPDALEVAVPRDLRIRAVTEKGNTAKLYEGTVELAASGGGSPIGSQPVALESGDRGEAVVSGAGRFLELGEFTVTATDASDPPLEGTLAVTVVVTRPHIHPALPALTPADGSLDVAGFSFPSEEVELLVDDAVVATTTAGADGAFAFPTHTLASGTHTVRAEALDPESAERRASQTFTVTGPGRTERPVVTSPAGQEPPADDADADAVALYTAGPGGHSTVLSNGEKRVERVDLEVPGRGQVHFVFRRRYRSQLRYDGPLGHGWDFTYNERLFFEGSGDVVRLNGRGHVDTWVRNPDGSFTAPAGHFGTLTEEEDGRFVLREPDGFRHVYRPDGRLVRLEDRFGNAMAFAYDAGDRLDSAEDVYGRRYDFDFEPSPDGIERLAAVRDSSGREVRFTYDERGDLVAARSPVVTGTSTGNDFPDGRTEAYSYLADPAAAELEHNLETITFPEEVASGGPPACTFAYGASGTELDRLVSATIGGTNASGVAAGGTVEYAYTPVNEGQPPGQPGLARLEALVTERNGNAFRSHVDELGHEILRQRLTAEDPADRARPDDPPSFDTRSVYDPDGQLLRRILPEGNELRYTYDASGPRAAQRNLLELRRVPDAERGGGEDLVTTLSYEPVYNQLASVTGPRGNAPDFTPPVGEASAERYTTRRFFDYQESTDPIPDAGKYAIDLSGVARGLGDLNADGRTDQVQGTVVRTEAPAVHLPGSFHEAQRLDPSAGAGDVVLQEIVTECQWNDRGQLTARIDPEGNRTTYTYYPGDDPDGDGTPVGGEGDGGGAGAGAAGGGYLETITRDAEPAPSRRTAPVSPVALRVRRFWDAAGNLVAERDPRGVETRYEVNALREVVGVTRGADVVEAVARGELITGEAAFGYRIRWTRDHNGRVVLVEIENRAGVSTTEGVGDWIERTTTYDILNNPIIRTAEVDADETITTGLRYDPNDLLTRITHPRGNVDTIQYDERNLPFRVTEGFGSPEAGTYRIDYDWNGNRERLVDAHDNDGDGSPEETVRGYDGLDRLTTVTGPVGTTTVRVYDPASNVTRVQVFGHPAGEPSEENVLHRDVRFRYDELNRRYETVTDIFVADGFYGQFETPPEPPGDGLQTGRREYDALSRPTFRVEDDGDTHQIVYDGASRPVERIGPAGNRQLVSYDQNSNPVRVEQVDVNPEGLVPDEHYVHFYVWDQLDRLVRTTDPHGLTSRAEYDSRDLPTVLSDAQGPTLASDPLGLFPEPGQSGQVNAEGNTTTCFYDGLGRKTAVVRDLRQGGEGGNRLETSNPFNTDGQVTVAYGWDPNSNPTSVTGDNGHQTTWTYDERDRCIQQTNADGGQYTYVHDPDSNPVGGTDPNGTQIQWVHDAANRLVETQVTPAADVTGTTRETFEYDGLHRRTASNNHNDLLPGGRAANEQTVEWIYDSRGLCLEEIQNGVSVQRAYSGDGNRTSVRYGGSGRTIREARDGLGRVTRIDDATDPESLVNLLRIAYIGPKAREVERVFGNGAVQTLAYDDCRRVVRTETTVPGGGGGASPGAGAGETAGPTLLDRSYTYNRADRITTESRGEVRPGTDTFTLDSLYRIAETRFEPPRFNTPALGQDGFAESMRYTLDGAGNRREVDRDLPAVPLPVESWEVNEVHEYTQILGLRTFQYDANGNLADDGARTFHYDYRNRLVEVRDKASGDVIQRNTYYADYRRARKQVFSPYNDALPSGDARYVYDGYRVVEQTDEASYVYGPGGPDDLVEGRGYVSRLLPYYFHKDARNNVVALTFGTQEGHDLSDTWVIQSFAYDDFGFVELVERNPVESFRDPFLPAYLFQGRRFDAATGFHSFRHRVYSPGLGRFIQRDPAGLDPAGSWYGFPGRNPVSERDPWGLCEDCEGGSVGYSVAELIRLAEGKYDDGAGGMTRIRPPASNDSRGQGNPSVLELQDTSQPVIVDAFGRLRSPVQRHAVQPGRGETHRRVEGKAPRVLEAKRPRHSFEHIETVEEFRIGDPRMKEWWVDQYEDERELVRFFIETGWIEESYEIPVFWDWAFSGVAGQEGMPPVRGPFGPWTTAGWGPGHPYWSEVLDESGKPAPREELREPYRFRFQPERQVVPSGACPDDSGEESVLQYQDYGALPGA